MEVPLREESVNPGGVTSSGINPDGAGPERGGLGKIELISGCLRSQVTGSFLPSERLQVEKLPVTAVPTSTKVTRVVDPDFMWKGSLTKVALIKLR